MAGGAGGGGERRAPRGEEARRQAEARRRAEEARGKRREARRRGGKRREARGMGAPRRRARPNTPHQSMYFVPVKQVKQRTWRALLRPLRRAIKRNHATHFTHATPPSRFLKATRWGRERTAARAQWRGRLRCIRVRMRFLHTSAYVSIRQHTSAYVSIRQHTSADHRASKWGA